MRPTPGATNQKQFVDNLRRIQSDVSRAKKVVIIGGGTVGIEFAGVSWSTYAIQARS